MKTRSKNISFQFPLILQRMNKFSFELWSQIEYLSIFPSSSNLCHFNTDNIGINKILSSQLQTNPISLSLISQYRHLSIIYIP